MKQFLSLKICDVNHSANKTIKFVWVSEIQPSKGQPGLFELFFLLIFPKNSAYWQKFVFKYHTVFDNILVYIIKF